MTEWDSENSVDYTGLILSYVFAVIALMLVTACLNGCSPTWPDIGGGIRVKDIKIRSCNQLEDECGAKV